MAQGAGDARDGRSVLGDGRVPESTETDDVPPCGRLADAVFDAMAEGVVIADETGCLVACNAAARDLLGADPPDRVLARWPERYGLHLHDGLTPCPAEAFPVLRAARGETVPEVELFVRSRHVPDGRWLSGNARPLTDASGRHCGGLLLLRDVTQRKRVGRTIDEDRARLRQQIQRHESLAALDMTVHEAAGLPDLLERVEQLAQQLVPARAALVAIRDPEVCGLIAGRHHDGRSTFDHEAAVRWVLEHRRPLCVADLRDDPFALGRSARDGGFRSYAAVPLLDDGQATGVLFTLDRRPRHFAQDDLDFMSALAGRAAVAVTKVRLYEQLRAANASLARHREDLELLVQERTQALEATHRRLRRADRLASIGTLAAGLGHDMNNVLFPVRCRLDAVDRERVPSELNVLLHSISDAVEYLQQLTDGLRLFALDPDVELPEAYTDLEPWWQQISPLLAQTLPDTITLRSRIGRDLPRVPVAPHRLTQALLNLVVNASEAMPDGGHVDVRAERDPERGHVRIDVGDEGPGMPPEVQVQAFDPFFTTKKRGLSTGLGLSLVHGVVTSAGGTIDVHTTPGVGTTMSLSFPAATADRPSADTVPPHGRAVVTLADPHVAAWVERLLLGAGFDAARAETSDAAQLWVTEPAAERLSDVRRFADGDEGRRVIVLGPAEAAWHAMGATVVEAPAELAAWRAAIDAVIAAGEERST